MLISIIATECRHESWAYISIILYYFHRHANISAFAMVLDADDLVATCRRFAPLLTIGSSHAGDT